MTESEAVEYLKNRYLVVGSRVNGGEKGIKRCEQHNESIDMAIQALEKQIPKRPIKSKEQRIRYVNTYYCPTCNLGFTGFNIAKWCYHCGQKLDWSDDE
jgi:hypothetical protein